MSSSENWIDTNAGLFRGADGRSVHTDLAERSQFFM
jgi:hypothetical protein